MAVWQALIQKDKTEIIRSLQDYIRIPSVSGLPVCNKAVNRDAIMSGKGPLKALNFLLDLGKKMGFVTYDIGGLGGIVEYGEGNSAVGIAIHADTVPVGKGWTIPPLEGIVRDNKIYGRGAIDNKGPGIAAFYALKAVKDAGLSLKKKVQIIIGIDEEIIWDCTSKMLHQITEPDFIFIPDGDFPLINAEKGLIWAEYELQSSPKKNTQKGIEIQYLKGGDSFNIVPDYCEAALIVEKDFQDIFLKRLQEYIKATEYDVEIFEKSTDPKGASLYILISRGKSVHACNCGQGVNAISQLIVTLANIGLTNAWQRDFIEFYRKRIGTECNGEQLGLYFEDDISGKLTVNPAIIELDSHSLMLKFDIRFPATAKLEEVQTAFVKSLEPLEGTLTILDSLKSHYVSPDNDNIKKLLKVYSDFTGDQEVLPLAINGTTFAKAFKNAVAFGPLFPGMPNVEHNADEYIEIEHLLNCTEIYARAIYELTK